MGTTDSKHDKKDISSLFSSEEIEKLDKIYDKILSSAPEQEKTRISVSTARESNTCNHSQLSTFIKPFISDDDIINRLHETLCSMSDETDTKSTTFSIHGLRRYLAMSFKGTAVEKSLSISVLISSSGIMAHSLILQFVVAIMKSYFNIIHSHSSAQHWDPPNDSQIHACSLYLIKSLKQKQTNKEVSSAEPASEQTYSETDLEYWLSNAPFFNHIVDLVFHTCFNFTTFESHTPTEPILPGIVKDKKNATILNRMSILMVNFHIPPDQQSSWRLLFDSSYHGSSFSQLVNRVTHQGPFVIVVRDKSGHVFGGFCDTSLTENSDFYGSYKCFLFTLHPACGIYTSSGHNNNYIYFNHGAKTLPNGLGFGGQLNYYGLWIDNSFTSGHSKGGPLCSTYDSPQMSSQPEFEVDTLEVWGVGAKPEAISGQTSILDVDPGAKAILELMGKGGHSDGLREEDETACIPAEHSLPLL